VSAARDKAEVAASIEHWLALATEAEDQAAWDRARGFDLSLPGCSPGDHRARTFRRTAEALQLELETGRPHCSACLGDHPNHRHGHRG
jgi:hypothetical protein